MVAKLKLEGIDGRGPPFSEGAVRLSYYTIYLKSFKCGPE